MTIKGKMTFPSIPDADNALKIYLKLAQYPILASHIRARMRRVLFDSGAVTQQAFEADAREQAIRSQAREALHDPFGEEPADVWDLRLSRVRDHLTDFYFAFNLPYERFEHIILEELGKRGASAQEMLDASFNPEMAPQFMNFEQGAALERLSPEERGPAGEARLREIKVVLIRQLISDQLAYVNIAKEWFTISDLSEIGRHKIGSGKIGGKSAGMLLAKRILDEVASLEIRQHMSIPESYFLGGDVTYQFMALNGLFHWGDQKYKAEEQIRIDFPHIQLDFLAGYFPSEALESLRHLLETVGDQPLIVRSSSLLEDNFGTSFAGKYESHFCPNHAPTLEENLRNLTQAIQRIYASVFNPDALLYRRSKGLQDYDERMAILIQTVAGERFGQYFLPQGAGVAFSHNQFRWAPQIKREDGFVRLVWGLGTRAVDRVGNDYPRLVALSHPLLHPEAAPKTIRRYSQHYVDLIDLKDNQFKSLPVEEVFTTRYPPLRYIAQVDQGGYLMPMRSRIIDGGVNDLVITFDELLRRTPLAERLRTILNILEEEYHAPVDTEFTIQIIDPYTPNPEVHIYLLQCRPQSHLKESAARLPSSLNPADVIFSTRRIVPAGKIENIQYVLFITPEGYFALSTFHERAQLVHAINLVNTYLKGERFICVGPGRWGTSNSDLGVPIGYGDIYHTLALVELSGQDIGPAPEPSFGTHFFQDLVESNIYPLAVYLDDEGVIFNHDFFYHTPNQLISLLPQASGLADCLRLIEVSSFRPGSHLELVMDDEKGQAVAFLVPDYE
jgi:hypothetical protein